MTKQTFTTGQVLTAAQMTSLQQTAMGGGSTTAKTTSYVLVAADAGTVVQMNAAGATTITVNTALFAPGDTVQIQNIGAGVCTVTAGTATVSTSATLALKQYDSGDLYFNTTSAAFFFSTDAADGASPLTTKGDLYTYSTLDARLAVGANNTVLTADSAQATGLKWATPAASGKVLQVVYANYSTATTVTSTTVYADTGLTATITPTSATSKVLILINQGIQATRSSINIGGSIRTLRDATVIYTPSVGTYQHFYIESGGATSVGLYGVLAYTYLDSPATTSATAYKTQAICNNAANSGQVTTQIASSVSSITLLEIGA